MEFKHIVRNSGDASDDSDGYQDGPSTPNPPVWSEVCNSLNALRSHNNIYMIWHHLSGFSFGR